MMDNIARAVLEEHDDFRGARPLVDVEGLSSPRVCNFLNRMVARLEGDSAYLEIGTFRGLTLLSAAIDNPSRRCIGCDKFRVYGRFTGIGACARRALERNMRRYRGRAAQITFHHTTSERLFGERRIDAPVGVYFYDGDHSFDGTRRGIMAVVPHLQARAVIVVDDWNDPVIRGATFAALRDAQLEVLWERELAGDHGGAGFWNGVGVFFVARADA
jgi:hypothetical protein